MTTTIDWKCPECGSADTEISTWEAWCFDCEWRIEKDTAPEVFAKLRETELQRRQADERMDPAELRMVREYLGLTNEVLAGILGIRNDTVRRWETGRDPIPYRIREEIEAIEERTAVAVGELIDVLNDAGDPVVGIYPSDADLHAARPDMSHLSARWWRHVVARACQEVPGVQIKTA